MNPSGAVLCWGGFSLPWCDNGSTQVRSCILEPTWSLSPGGPGCTAAETPARTHGSTCLPLEGPQPSLSPIPTSRGWPPCCPSDPASPWGDTGCCHSPHLSPASTGHPACRVSPSPSPFLRRFHQNRAAFCRAKKKKKREIPELCTPQTELGAPELEFCTPKLSQDPNSWAARAAVWRL